MSDVEQPLDRLNYYNGQRLEAADFRLEQEFHIRVRRWLNKSLYTWGIAAGLEVMVKEGDPHKVVVSPGMALDIDGREIILLEAREVPVVGNPSQIEGVVSGNYLVIQYQEEKVAALADGCAVPLKDKTGSKVAWGGPSRVRSEPDICFQNDWPYKEGGQKIVLAQVELDEACAVRHIHTSVRKYAGAAQPGEALAYALEGEKDIDSNKDNSKKIYFHIRGGRPNAVTLYLRGAKFSSLYYTELGQHKHGISFNSGAGGAIAAHDHTVDLSDIKTDEGDPSSHRHEIWADTDDSDSGAMETGTDGGTGTKDQMLTGVGGVKGGRGDMEVKPAGTHTHSLIGDNLTITTTPEPKKEAHFHGVTGDTNSTGFSPAARTSGSTLTYIDDLQIELDATSYTKAIRDRLGWSIIGNGTGDAADLLVQTGTGPIQFELLGADLNEGEHLLELKVNKGGGRILYNLYVE